LKGDLNVEPFRKKATHKTPTSEDIREILQLYGALLEDQSKPLIMDESLLPASKEKLKQALLAVIIAAQTEEAKEAHKGAYVLLSSFFPALAQRALIFRLITLRLYIGWKKWMKRQKN